MNGRGLGSADVVVERSDRREERRVRREGEDHTATDRGQVEIGAIRPAAQDLGIERLKATSRIGDLTPEQSARPGKQHSRARGPSWVLTASPTSRPRSDSTRTRSIGCSRVEAAVHRLRQAARTCPIARAHP